MMITYILCVHACTCLPEVLTLALALPVVPSCQPNGGPRETGQAPGGWSVRGNHSN